MATDVVEGGTAEGSSFSKTPYTFSVCKHLAFGSCECECSRIKPGVCITCNAVFCKICSRNVRPHLLQSTQYVFTEEDVSAYAIEVIQAMQTLVKGRPGSPAPSPIEIETRVKAISMGLQRMISNTASCDKEVQTSNINNNICSSSHNEMQSSINDEGESWSANDELLLNQIKPTLAAESIPFGSDVDTELVCGTCGDIITLYSNDFNLSFQRHCHEARHILAMGMKEGNTPSPRDELSTRSVKITNDCVALCEKVLGQLINEPPLQEGLRFVEITPKRIDFKFSCHLCNVTASDIECFKVHLNGGPHRTKFKKESMKRHTTKELTLSGSSSDILHHENIIESQAITDKEFEKQLVDTTCKECEKYFMTESALLQHSRDVHQDPEKHNSTATHVQKQGINSICKICNMTLSTDIMLVQHTENCHQNKDSFIIQNSERLASAEQKVQEIPIDKTCKVCDKSFLTERALCQHTIDSGHGKSKNSNRELVSRQHQVEKNSPIVQLPGSAYSNSPFYPDKAGTQKLVSENVGELSEKRNFASQSNPHVYASKWIRVVGKGLFSLDYIFNTFSSLSVIAKILLFKKEAWIQFNETSVAANIVETWRSLHLSSKILLVSSLSEEESKKVRGIINRVDLSLPYEALHIVKNKNVFHKTCLRLLEEAHHAEEDLYKVDNLCNLLEELLKHTFPNCKSYGFGSRALGLASRNSDVDIFFDIGENYHGEDMSVGQKEICNFVYQALLNSKQCKKIERVLSARVPIVKFIHHEINLACDVSFRCGLGHRNTLLLKHYLEMNDWLKSLILVTKEWLRRAKIPAGKRGMTSYTLILMIIFYLQSLSPPLLPSVSYLQELTTSKVFLKEWDCSIPEKKTFFPQSHPHNCSTESLLKGFFLFYGSFDFEGHIICPLVGQALKRSVFNTLDTRQAHDFPSTLMNYLHSLRKGQAAFFQNDKPVCVQDPFELSHNVAKGVPLTLLLKFRAHCLASQKAIEEWNYYNVQDPPLPLNSRLLLKM